jgi:hypothetical protein
MDVASPLSPAEAIEALAGLSREYAPDALTDMLRVEVTGSNIHVRYLRDSSESKNLILNALRCTYRGRIEPLAEGCRLHGRFTLPWLHVAMLLIAFAILVLIFPTPFVETNGHLFFALFWPALFYSVTTVPMARADIPYIERNLRYALTGSNDGG